MNSFGHLGEGLVIWESYHRFGGIRRRKKKKGGCVSLWWCVGCLYCCYLGGLQKGLTEYLKRLFLNLSYLLLLLLSFLSGY